jgi:hypothetical protein
MEVPGVYVTRNGKLKKKENNFTPSTRQLVLAKSDGRCWYCGVELVPAQHYHFEDGMKAFTVDHFENFGGNGLSNLVPACRDCNGRKKGMGIDRFRETQSARFGCSFTQAQRDFWSSLGVTLPNNYPFSFYFERMGLRR